MRMMLEALRPLLLALGRIAAPFRERSEADFLLADAEYRLWQSFRWHSPTCERSRAADPALHHGQSPGGSLDYRNLDSGTGAACIANDPSFESFSPHASDTDENSATWLRPSSNVHYESSKNLGSL